MYVIISACLLFSQNEEEILIFFNKIDYNCDGYIDWVTSRGSMHDVGVLTCEHVHHIPSLGRVLYLHVHGVPGKRRH